MPSYLAHAYGERARFRHNLFARAEKRRRAMDLLKGMEGIAGIKPGANSLLVFLEPEGNLQSICENLEREFPELAAEETARSGKAIRKTGPQKNETFRKSAKSLDRRKLELKGLLVSGAATVGLALFGARHLHALAGGVFSLFAIQHVRQRKERLSF